MYKILTLLFTFSVLFTQNMFEGYSVSTSDNVDAIYLNPAGLGIDRQISTFFFPYQNNSKSSFSIKTADRYKNFGFSTYYKKEDKLFNPTNFSLALGKKVYENFYAGLSWNKKDVYSFGLLYRPSNFVSSGLIINRYNNDKNNFSIRYGFAIRPYKSKHNITLGVDTKYNNFNKNIQLPKYQLLPFLNIHFFQGLNFSINSISDFKNLNFENFNINLSINFDQFGFFAKSNNNNNGFGFFRTKSKLSSINTRNNTLKKDYSQSWVRLNMEGMFIEEPVKKQGFSFNINIPFLNNSFNGPVIQIRKWVEKLDALTNDDEIDGLIIDWSYIIAGFSKRQEIYNALKRFKNSGKKIIIYSTYGLSNLDFYLASIANEIYMHEDASIDLKGFNVERTFYKGLFDTLGIVPEFVAITPYKSAGDSYTRKDFSPEVKENLGKLYKSIYNQFVEGISYNKSWDINKTKSIIDNGPYFNDLMIKNGLITGYLYPDEFEDYISKINNKKIIISDWNDVNINQNYNYSWIEKQKPKIAIIYAVGAIMPGESYGNRTGSRTMGDITIREAIKNAREDQSIDAIVLRIDSPGGSGSASDLIWREIFKTTNSDTTNTKPIIASMSDVAASGGYYIACQADTILAYPGTITGSIGVLGGRINLSGFMEKIGVSYDRMVFGENAAWLSGGKLWTDIERKRFEKLITEFYGKFLNKVVSGRNIDELDSLKLDSIAGGRVWTGEDAVQHNLVDELGGLYDAIEIAKKTSGFSVEDEVEIVEFPKNKGFNFFKAFNGLSTKKEISYTFNEYQELINLLEIIDSDEILYYMPYKIKFK